MLWLWIWGIVTAIALIVEFVTSDLITIWFAAGGLVTLLVVALAPNLDVVWQLVIFASVSLVLLICTRKMCLKFLRADGSKANTDSLIGRRLIVKNIQENDTYYKINGTVWHVFAVEGETLEVGCEFEICDIRGNKLIAKKIGK